MKVFVDKQEVRFETEDFPILISAHGGSGASLFSIHLMLNLFRQGKKILFFSAFPAAKEDFLRLLTEEEHGEVEFIERAEDATGKQAILARSGDESVLLDLIRMLSDITDRVVLIKNIEEYSPAVGELIKRLDLVVASGDIDQCSFVNMVTEKSFPTKIFFSAQKAILSVTFQSSKNIRGTSKESDSRA